MKSLALFSLTVLWLVTLSCNKEERKLKSIKSTIAGNWKWNGHSSYGTFTDTLIPIQMEDENLVKFMGMSYIFSGHDETQKTLRYTGNDAYEADIITYYYEKDSVYYAYKESILHSSPITVISSKR